MRAKWFHRTIKRDINSSIRPQEGHAPRNGAHSPPCQCNVFHLGVQTSLHLQQHIKTLLTLGSKSPPASHKIHPLASQSAHKLYIKANISAMHSTILLSWLSALTLITALPQGSVFTSSTTTNINGVISSNVVSSGANPSASSSSTTSSSTTINGVSTSTTYISIRNYNGPFLAVDAFQPLAPFPVNSAVTLIQNLASTIPQNSNGFSSPLKTSSNGINLVLAVPGSGAALGNDFMKDALKALANFFQNDARRAFAAKLRIVNSRSTPLGQESVVGNITLTF